MRQADIASLKGILLISHKECLKMILLTMKITSFMKVPLRDQIGQSA
jgi:hypothetical protein